MLTYIAALLVCCFRNKASAPLGDSRTAYIKYGNIFAEKGILVIPFNCYFDTFIDPNVLKEDSVAGQLVTDVFRCNYNEIDNKIDSELKKVQITHDRRDKPGKQNAYPIGTVIKIEKNGNEYYCVALTDVGDSKENFKSVCDIEKLHIAIVSLLKYMDKDAGVKNVYMPLLGSGFSRINKPKQIILEYLISTFKISNISMQSKLHIVLVEKERKEFDLTKRF